MVKLKKISLLFTTLLIIGLCIEPLSYNAEVKAAVAEHGLIIYRYAVFGINHVITTICKSFTVFTFSDKAIRISFVYTSKKLSQHKAISPDREDSYNCVWLML